MLNVEVLLFDLGFWIVSETEMAGSAVKDTLGDEKCKKRYLTK
jgi:hypothetical protein